MVRLGGRAIADATLHIKLESEPDPGGRRYNPDLDAAFGVGPPPLPKRPQPSGMPITPADPDRQHHFYQGDQIHKGVPPLPKGAGSGPGLGEQLGKALGIDAAALAAAGPLAAAVIAAQQLTASFQRMREGVDAVAAGFEGLAANDIGAMRQASEDLAKSAIGAVPILGDLVIADLELVKAITSLPEKISQAFLNRAHQIAQYSGPISAAEAMANVRNIKADIREAHELGPGLARMVTAQSHIEQDIRELLLPIKKFVVEVLAPLMEFAADAIHVVRTLPEVLREIANDVTEAIILALELEWTKARDKIGELPDKLAKILQRQDDNPGVLFDNFLRDFGAARFGAP